MIDLRHLTDIVVSSETKILLLVVDGLGGLADPETGKSELETASIPNLDQLARDSSCGLTIPVLLGITPGSGPGHLALFGYDPEKYLIGRGVLEALGVGVALREDELAARGNFCRIDANGRIMDRRAGRISTEESTALCEKLRDISIEGVEIAVYPVREHRFVLVLRGSSLDAMVTETDPQEIGVAPLSSQALQPHAANTARIVNQFTEAVKDRLRGSPLANMVLLRGFARLPQIPLVSDAYKLNPAGIAAYPMYRGMANLVGMSVLDAGASFQDEIDTLIRHYDEYNLFYLHYKPADSAGEDGNFEAKVRALEELDGYISQLVSLNPEVLIVAGDHSTPAIVGGHSWHPVPVSIRSRWTGGSGCARFSEREFRLGDLGVFPAQQLMLLALAHAGKLKKYGP